MDTNELFESVRKLNLPIGKFILFGSAPIVVRGLRECRDIDILVTEDVWESYRNKPEWKLKETPKGSEYWSHGDIELWKDWNPPLQNIEKVIKEADIINGLPFGRLEDVVKRKKIRGQEKDLKDIELIEEFWRTSKK